MMELHVIIPGRAPELVVRVVDGRPVVIPPESAPQTQKSGETAGHELQAEL